MANRVRQLEDALQESHSWHSAESHPLLTDDLLQIKRPLERDGADQISVKEERTEGPDAIDALGSLSVLLAYMSTLAHILQDLSLKTAAQISLAKQPIHG